MSRVAVASVPAWSRVCSTAFVPLRVRTAAPEFRASLDQASLAPTTTLTWVRSAASEVFRDARTVRDHPRDDVLLSLHYRGAGTVAQHGRLAALTPGAAVLYDASAPYTLTFPQAIDEVVLQVPRHVLPKSGRAVRDLTARPLLASGALRALFTLARSTSPQDVDGTGYGETIADAVTALLRASLDGERTALPLDAAELGTVVRAYVREHAADPDCSPEQMARAHFVSLRTLQKLFARSGDTPADYLRRERLALGHDRLLAGQSVQDAAFRSGFRDVDTFSRAYKRTYGEVPSAARHGV